MSNLTGITNANEFYSNHYLDAILKDDIKGVDSRWKEREKQEENYKTPVKRLSALASDYFRLRERFRKQRNDRNRLGVQREWLGALLPVLGYDLKPERIELEEGQMLPVVAQVNKGNGLPLLLVLEALPDGDEATDVLSLEYKSAQLSDLADSELDPESDLEEDSGTNKEKDSEIMGVSLEDVVSDWVFSQEEPPHWVIIASMDQVVLIDRYKWNASRLLSFDLGDILSRKENDTLLAMATLLHREHTCPEEGSPLLDELDEKSHKHAYSVSDDLKYALRESIELLGNEAVWYIRNKLKEGVFKERLDEGQLTLECLRYMYRLLFLFYIEARQDLGYAPMDAEIYRQGYSLEALRELEQTELRTAEDSDGYFVDGWLKQLFRLIWEGYPAQVGEQQEINLAEAEVVNDTFTLAPLQSHLFDPDRLKLLNRVKFRNVVLRQVIELMSLSREKKKGKGKGKGKNRKRRGRISYAQLGINQLGAVYEALLCFRGFFAEEDLYEVKRASDSEPNPLEVGYFVKADDLEKYTDEERVFEKDGSPKCYPKGTFIYRLAGRDRENSASYYTPESLTKCLVKYTLKELLKDKTADDILGLHICEPAMGSAAFLNEAINQLAEKYLDLKQQELDKRIPHDDYLQEKQKVKMFLADRNVFGIDLNPVAVELAEVSLWLNSIYKPEGKRAFVPWFGMQLHCGNSLMGARRQVYDTTLIPREKKQKTYWYTQEPQRVMLPEPIPAGHVYHFLLPDFGMAEYKDRVIKSLAPDEIEHINDWRREFCKEPWSTFDIERLVSLSKRIDELWMLHAKELRAIRQRTTDPLVIWGQDGADASEETTTLQMKEKILWQEQHSKGIASSSAYRRLKLVMDYWCSLWFWPIMQAELLPNRQEWLMELAVILGDVELALEDRPEEQLQLYPETNAAKAQELTAEYGFVSVLSLCDRFPRLQLVSQITQKKYFFHWELEFADIFIDNGGFDLILGNPPWIKVEWDEGGVLGDVEPVFQLRKFSASKLTKLRDEAIAKFAILRELYLMHYESSAAVQNFLNTNQNYPLLSGQKANLFKCFLPRSWYGGNSSSVQGFLHPEGIYDDPKAFLFREATYPRLRLHFQFQNELRLFPEVHHTTVYSINVYGRQLPEIQFSHVANLFVPSTIDDCFDIGIQHGALEGIKDDFGNWSIKGSPERIIDVEKETLDLFAQLYDDSETIALQARLPAIHSKQVLNVLKAFVRQSRKLKDIEDKFCITPSTCWNEVTSQNDNSIKRDTCFPEKLENFIVSGPHFFVGNPLNKTPREICTDRSHYDVLDLTFIPDDYLSRTIYVPGCEFKEYLSRIPRVPWAEDSQEYEVISSKLNSFYRLAFRGMIGSWAERTLIGTIIPKGCMHINACKSYVFSQRVKLEFITFGAFTCSLPYDFVLKSSGRSNLQETLNDFPLVIGTNSDHGLASRFLSLNCLTI
ncbi:MAG: N-6 DNA methylase, partial [Cyanobacteria bacterium J06656_5]